MESTVHSMVAIRGEKSRMLSVFHWLRTPLCSLVLAVADVVASFAAVALAFLERTAFAQFFPIPSLEFVSWVEVGSLMAIATLAGFLLRGMYLRHETFWEMVRLILTTLARTIVVGITILFLMKVATLASRTMAVLSAANLFLLLPILRMTGVWLLHRQGLWQRHVLLIGAPSELSSAAEDLEYDFALGYHVAARHAYQNLDDLPDANGFDEVVVSSRGLQPHDVGRIVSDLHYSTKRVTVIPDLGDLPFGWGRSRFLFDQRRILLTRRNLLLQRGNLLVKRSFDLLVTLLGLIPAVPLLMLLAIAVRLDSRGPAFLRQERLGHRGRRFRCVKLRTMTLHADEELKTLLSDPERRKEWETYKKLRNDPRVTRVGRFLRATSLDELPQIFNVLLGDMSLVGPRPYLPREFEAMAGYHETILRCRPGITGLWQISGRTELAFDQRVDLESWYVHNWSLWLDITILLRTLPAVLGRRGAH